MKLPRPEELMQELERQGIKVGPTFLRPRLAAAIGLAGDLVGVGVAI